MLNGYDVCTEVLVLG